MTDFTRGASILFSQSGFKDEAGADTTVIASALRLNFCALANGRRSDVDVDMTESAGVWTHRWDSSVAKAGTVYWSILAPGVGGTVIAMQGSFNLVGNAANP